MSNNNDELNHGHHNDSRRRSRSPTKENNNNNDQQQQQPQWIRATCSIPPLYQTLGITSQDQLSLSEKELHRIYKKLALQKHPDRHHHRSDHADGDQQQEKIKLEFQQIQHAIATLGDSKKRREYDAKFGINRHLRLDALLTESNDDRMKNQNQNQNNDADENENQNENQNENESDDDDDYQFEGTKTKLTSSSSDETAVKEDKEVEEKKQETNVKVGVDDDEWAALF